MLYYQHYGRKIFHFQKSKQLSLEEYAKIKEKLAKSKLKLTFPWIIKVCFIVPLALLCVSCYLLPCSSAFFGRTLNGLITDFITFILKHFLPDPRSLTRIYALFDGPFSIIVATIISIVYYQITKDLIISLLIGLIGPLLLHLLLKFLLKTWAKATNTDIKPDFLKPLGRGHPDLDLGLGIHCLYLNTISRITPSGEKH